jgi:hypothetical protein
VSGTGLGVSGDRPPVGVRLASALAGRMRPFLPAGLAVTDVGGTIWVTDGTWRSGTPLDELIDSPVVAPSLGSMDRGITVWDGPDQQPFDHTIPTSNATDDATEMRDSIATATRNALSRIQDFVTETLTEPWPPDPECRSGAVLPPVGVQWSGDVLKICFGDMNDPVLELEAIPARELLNGEPSV